MPIRNNSQVLVITWPDRTEITQVIALELQRLVVERGGRCEVVKVSANVPESCK